MVARLLKEVQELRCYDDDFSARGNAEMATKLALNTWPTSDRKEGGIKEYEIR